MNIVYLSRINFFSNKAHVHTILKTCEALGMQEGVRVTLVSTDNSLSAQSTQETFFIERGVRHSFSIVSLSSWANIWKNSPNFFIYNLSTVWANISFVGFVWKNRKSIDVVYFRDHLILPVILCAKYLLGKKIVYESHYILTKRLGQWLTERSVAVSDGVVAIAGVLKEYYLTFNTNIIVSYCTSSDKELFERSPVKDVARQQLGLRQDMYYLVYTGNIDVTGNGDSYGVEDIVRALPLLPVDICFVAVGKKTQGEHVLERLARSLGVADRFMCVPWVPREQFPVYVSASDVLIIPKSGAQAGNSPTKMFEYLATHRPIVGANTVPISEILHDGVNASVVDYTNPRDWADKILYIRAHPDYAEKITTQAYADAGLYTWSARGVAIGTFIKQIYA